jgi:hypothetical protein
VSGFQGTSQTSKEGRLPTGKLAVSRYRSCGKRNFRHLRDTIRLGAFRRICVCFWIRLSRLHATKLWSVLQADKPRRRRRNRANFCVHSHSALRSDQASTPHVVSVPLVTFERHRVPCCSPARYSGVKARAQHARYEHDLQAYLFHSSFHLPLRIFRDACALQQPI